MAEIDPTEIAGELLATNKELTQRLQSMSMEAWNERFDAEEWSAAEVVGHMAELEVHWARMAAALANQPGLDVGRPLDDPERLAGPESTASGTPAEGIERLIAAGQEAAAILRSIPSERWSVSGERDGEPRTVAEIVRRSVLDHARLHVDQCLAALEGKIPS